ncbi:MAG: DUF2569 family protein [Thermodesulfobacteriota bacterium]|nr:DUF2569 family protein [Thermodesulfobacteriota bacterium]
MNCPECQKVLKISNEMAGKKGKCPGCGTVFTIPSVSEKTESKKCPKCTTSMADKADLCNEYNDGQQKIRDMNSAPTHTEKEHIPDKSEKLKMKLKRDKKGRIQLGGWLVLPMIGIALSGLSLLQVYVNWNVIEPKAPLVAFLSVVIGVYIVLLSIWIEKRKSFVPKNFIILMVLIFIFNCTFSAYFQIEALVVHIVVQLPAVALWTAYFLKSERVKLTFGAY